MPLDQDWDGSLGQMGCCVQIVLNQSEGVAITLTQANRTHTDIQVYHLGQSYVETL